MKNLSKILLAGLFLLGLSTMSAMEKDYEHPPNDLKLEMVVDKSTPDVVLISPESNLSTECALALAAERGISIVVVSAEMPLQTLELPKLIEYKLSEVICEPASELMIKPRSKFMDPPRFNFKK